MSLRVDPPGTHLPAEVTDLVAAWAPGRRWFPGGVTGRPTPWLEVTDDAAPGGEQSVVLALLRLDGSVDGALDGAADGTARGAVAAAASATRWPSGAVVLQVPLVLSAAGRGQHAEPGCIGRAAGLAVHDGGAHPAAWAMLLRPAAQATHADADAVTEPEPEPEPEPDVTGGRTLTGEQSNTSVVLPHIRPPGAPHGAMLKILRTLTGGEHPDVTVPQALTAAGFTGTPRFLGAAEVTCGATVVDLAVLAALVPDAHDGFEHACRFAGRGEPFDALAAELGTVVARLHAALRDALPTTATLDPSDFVTRLRRRAETAIEAAPSLAPHATAVGRLLDDLRERLTAVPLQRIHGDLHLGQALYGSDGWQLLDFEGEPQRPVAQRTAPDLPVRDVAGMLRSFDYAAAVGGADDPGWTRGAKSAFLTAYREQDGGGLDEDVLRALVLDKALYEVVYETRQRPHWVHIPLGAVAGLLAGAPLDA